MSITRVAQHAWRCHGCNCLFFQWRGTCPGCDAQDWSPRPTEVWVPASLVPMSEQTLGAVGQDPGDRSERAEERRQLAELITSWPAGQLRTVATRIFLDGWSLDDSAAEQGLAARDRPFKQLVADVVNHLGQLTGHGRITKWSHLP
jgi:hypothetical protein